MCIYKFQGSNLDPHVNVYQDYLTDFPGLRAWKPDGVPRFVHCALANSFAFLQAWGCWKNLVATINGIILSPM